jgi:hypothetical protein
MINYSRGQELLLNLINIILRESLRCFCASPNITIAMTY